MLITLEGIDGVGKSTLLKELESNIEGCFTKEPGSSHIPLNKTIREMVLHNKDLTAFQRELLFYVDAQSHRAFIKSQRNQLVISDRGEWSHIAYLYGTLKTHQMLYEDFGLCKKLIEQSCAKPDAVIYLQGDLKLMEERLRGEKDAIESLGQEFYSYVLAQYDDLLIATELCKLPVLVLNARDSLVTNVAKAHAFIAYRQELAGLR